MEISEAIDKALPLFLKYKVEDEELIDVFEKEGIPSSMARKLILFMPIAFGRIMMDELGANLRDEFIYTRKKGIFTDKTQKKLTDEKIYRESLKKASQMSGKKETGEIFLAIAFRSCEVNAVNDMELKGLNPQNAVFTPIEFFWELDEDQEHDDLESTQPKNWWEFWK